MGRATLRTVLSRLMSSSVTQRTAKAAQRRRFEGDPLAGPLAVARASVADRAGVACPTLFESMKLL